MLTNLEALKALADSGSILVEPGVDFQPVNAWEDDANGKRRPTGPQYKIEGLPLWQIAVRARNFYFGRCLFRDATLFVAAASRPVIDEILGD